MFQHTKNILELSLYSGVSCALSFMTRILPATYYPILILRLLILLYCLYVINKVENQKVLAYLLSAAIFIGFIGGFWDLVEVYLLLYGNQLITAIFTSLIIILFCAFLFFTQRSQNEKQS
jgi:hypothetical protein